MRIAVAMSGGVDSSVAALLLREQGHEVFGISMLLYDAPGTGAIASDHRCCGVRDIADARRVAGELRIPFYVANMKEDFRRAVVDRFVRSYATGRTPIPCIPCNADLKFDALLARVRTLGADALATGHYARVDAEASPRRLLRSVDRGRDQSYFLYHLDQRTLPFVTFPVGGMAKEQVRERARTAGLPVCDKPDSQEICFVAPGRHAGFVAAMQQVPPGDVRDDAGQLLGRHAGIHNFTVGQRRGLGLSGQERRYVTRIDGATATVVVGTAADLMQRHCHVEELSWVRPPELLPLRAAVRIRSRHDESPATVSLGASSGTADVEFDQEQRGVAPGQAAVFYLGDEVLGGGVIAPRP